jgi:hypothetical protein
MTDLPFPARLAALAASITLVVAGCASTAAPKAAKVTCGTGPAEKTIGMAPWFVFACDDGRSIGLGTAPGNPADPFFFLVRPSTAGVRVQGDGAGDRAATVAAFAELKSMSEEDVARLHMQALEAAPAGQ